MKSKINLIILTIGKKPLIGLYNYKDNNLVEIIAITEQLSEGLPLAFKDIDQKYQIEKIAFVNGPGSFMAIKIGYIFLRTFEIVRQNIELLGNDGFYFNNNMPIKAINNLWFIKENSSIEIKKLDNIYESEFILPKIFKYSEYSKNIEPIYILNAI
jgi:tRNA A37 threonylcarbamoyladenosine modification protein TsaB